MAGFFHTLLASLFKESEAEPNVKHGPTSRPEPEPLTLEELPNALSESYALTRLGKAGEYILRVVGEEDYEEVAALLAEAIRAAPDDPVPRIARHILEGDYEGAVTLLTGAIQAMPDDPALYILRAFCWGQAERKFGGISRKPDIDRDLTRALELEPDNIMLLRARCPTTATTTRYKRHIQDLTRLLELDPAHWDSYLTSRAYRYHWVKDDASARVDLEELLRRGARRTVDLDYLLEEFGL